MVDEPIFPPSFAARWFDGRTGAAHSARAVIHERRLVVQPEGSANALSFLLSDLRISEPLARAPRLIDLPGGGVVHIDETSALAASLAASGVRTSVVVRWQRMWPAATVSLLLLLALTVWLYLDGLPRAADWAADQVPPALEERLGNRTLEMLDRRILSPSTLNEARRSELTRRFIEFQSRAGLEPVRRIEFRSIRTGHGVNAFALPGGVIVFLDGIIALGDEDEEILLAVFAHEYGHEARHHMTRSLFRALGSVALAGVLWGDYSSVASNGAVLFGQLRYSRHDETQADDFAFATLARAGVSPGAVARFLWRAEATSGRKAGAKPPEWLSTHPGARDRAERALEAAEVYRNAAASATLR